MVAFEEILAFWLEELEPKHWYQQDDDVDAAIRSRFLTVWEAAQDGALRRWCWCPDGTLAFLIVTDQFPRNLFRGEAQAFATDPLALRAAKTGIARGFDLRIPEPQRQFYYLPLEHSEVPADQNRAVRLIQARMPESNGSTLLHARAHRQIIRDFGRFPFRNGALGRDTSPEESAFLTEGGYGAVVRGLQAGA